MRDFANCSRPREKIIAVLEVCNDEAHEDVRSFEEDSLDFRNTVQAIITLIKYGKRVITK